MIYLARCIALSVEYKRKEKMITIREKFLTSKSILPIFIGKNESRKSIRTFDIYASTLK